MRYRVLGPLQVAADPGRWASIVAAKERQLLATLLANAGEVHSADRLIEALWADAAPSTARKTLQTYISHLRRIVGSDLVTEPGGYVIRIADEALDAACFERLTSDGRIAILRGRFVDAAERLGSALALWRGAAYTDVEPEGAVGASMRYLSELRLAASEDWFEARLETGEDRSLVPELEAVVADHPGRERSWRSLMLALYRSGRQADALDAFQRARRALIEEFGIEPGAELRALEAAILAHDPAVGRPPTSVPVAKYATTSDGLDIAYLTYGDGPTDIVFCAEVTLNLELLWDLAEFRPVLERLGRANRVVAIQRRGTGLSDRGRDRTLAPPAECVPDIDAVLAEVASPRAAFVGWGHGGQVALEYAAAHPERVTRLAVVNGYARQVAGPDYPVGLPPDLVENFLRYMATIWGTEVPKFPIFDPTVASDPEMIRRISRIERLTATPREAVAQVRALGAFDVRGTLDRVLCPSLVVFLSESVTGRANAQYLAEHLLSSEYIELPGAFLPTSEQAVRTGRRPRRVPERRRLNGSTVALPPSCNLAT